MNVDITMAPKDTGQSDGLCGFVDGDKTNDFKTRDGKVIPVNQGNRNGKFSDDWKYVD